MQLRSADDSIKGWRNVSRNENLSASESEVRPAPYAEASSSLRCIAEAATAAPPMATLIWFSPFVTLPRRRR